MRHRKSGRKLKRTASHRRATLSALSVSLIRHKRIQTTTAKAKETRMVVERLITKAKNAVAREASANKKDVHARRDVFAFLRDRAAVSTLFNEIAPKVATRPGGYTRVVKLGQRHGDGAQVAVIELVDFNVGQDKAAAKATTKGSQARRKQGSTKKTKTVQKPKTEAAGAEHDQATARPAAGTDTSASEKSGRTSKESH